MITKCILFILFNDMIIYKKNVICYPLLFDIEKKSVVLFVFCVKQEGNLSLLMIIYNSMHVISVFTIFS